MTTDADAPLSERALKHAGRLDQARCAGQWDEAVRHSKKLARYAPQAKLAAEANMQLTQAHLAGYGAIFGALRRQKVAWDTDTPERIQWFQEDSAAGDGLRVTRDALATIGAAGVTVGGMQISLQATAGASFADALLGRFETRRATATRFQTALASSAEQVAQWPFASDRVAVMALWFVEGLEWELLELKAADAVRCYARVEALVRALGAAAPSARDAHGAFNEEDQWTFWVEAALYRLGLLSARLGQTQRALQAWRLYLDVLEHTTLAIPANPFPRVAVNRALLGGAKGTGVPAAAAQVASDAHPLSYYALRKIAVLQSYLAATQRAVPDLFAGVFLVDRLERPFRLVSSARKSKRSEAVAQTLRASLRSPLSVKTPSSVSTVCETATTGAAQGDEVLHSDSRVFLPLLTSLLAAASPFPVGADTTMTKIQQDRARTMERCSEWWIKSLALPDALESTLQYWQHPQRVAALYNLVHVLYKLTLHSFRQPRLHRYLSHAFALLIAAYGQFQHPCEQVEGLLAIEAYLGLYETHLAHEMQREVKRRGDRIIQQERRTSVESTRRNTVDGETLERTPQASSAPATPQDDRALRRGIVVPVVHGETVLDVAGVCLSGMVVCHATHDGRIATLTKGQRFGQRALAMIHQHGVQLSPYERAAVLEKVHLYLGVLHVDYATEVPSLAQRGKSLRKAVHHLERALALSGEATMLSGAFGEAEGTVGCDTADTTETAKAGNLQNTSPVSPVHERSGDAGSSAPVLYSLAVAHCLDGRVDVALQLISRYLAVRPYDLEAQHLNVLVLSGRGERAPALQAVKSAVEAFVAHLPADNAPADAYFKAHPRARDSAGGLSELTTETFARLSPWQCNALYSLKLTEAMLQQQQEGARAALAWCMDLLALWRRVFFHSEAQRALSVGASYARNDAPLMAAEGGHWTDPHVAPHGSLPNLTVPTAHSRALLLATWLLISSMKREAGDYDEAKGCIEEAIGVLQEMGAHEEDRQKILFNVGLVAGAGDADGDGEEDASQHRLLKLGALAHPATRRRALQRRKLRQQQRQALDSETWKTQGPMLRRCIADVGIEALLIQYEMNRDLLTPAGAVAAPALWGRDGGSGQRRGGPAPATEPLLPAVKYQTPSAAMKRRLGELAIVAERSLPVGPGREAADLDPLGDASRSASGSAEADTRPASDAGSILGGLDSVAGVRSQAARSSPSRLLSTGSVASLRSQASLKFGASFTEQVKSSLAHLAHGMAKDDGEPGLFAGGRSRLATAQTTRSFNPLRARGVAAGTAAGPTAGPAAGPGRPQTRQDVPAPPPSPPRPESPPAPPPPAPLPPGIVLLPSRATLSRQFLESLFDAAHFLLTIDSTHLATYVFIGVVYLAMGENAVAASVIERVLNHNRSRGGLGGANASSQWQGGLTGRWAVEALRIWSDALARIDMLVPLAPRQRAAAAGRAAACGGRPSGVPAVAVADDEPLYGPVHLHAHALGLDGATAHSRALSTSTRAGRATLPEAPPPVMQWPGTLVGRVGSSRASAASLAALGAGESSTPAAAPRRRSSGASTDTPAPDGSLGQLVEWSLERQLKVRYLLDRAVRWQLACPVRGYEILSSGSMV